MAQAVQKTTSDFVSILGNKSRLYQTKTQEGAGILDSPDKGTLEFYCAGYTKPAEGTSMSRQVFHQALFARAVYLDAENKLYPIKPEEYRLNLVHDPQNKYDPNAIKIMLEPLSAELKHLLTIDNVTEEDPGCIDLGFVPRRINVNLLENMELIKNIEILKIKSGYHNKYYTTKIAVHYGQYKETSMTHERFSGLMDEL